MLVFTALLGDAAALDRLLEAHLLGTVIHEGRMFIQDPIPCDHRVGVSPNILKKDVPSYTRPGCEPRLLLPAA